MSDEWTVLFVTGDQLEAEMAKDILESGGIEVVVRSAKVSPYPVNIGRMGEIKLLVRVSDRSGAEEVLSRFREEAPSEAGDQGTDG